MAAGDGLPERTQPIGMNVGSPVVVALEGGGSKTVAVAIDVTGHVVAFGRGGSSLSLYVGDQRSLGAVEAALDAVAADIDPQPVEIVAGAMVGRGYATDPWDAVTERFPNARHAHMGEGDAALIGATLEPAGAVVLSGTGSFGRAVGVDGKSGHVGGNGPLVGDEGSGHYIAIEAIRRALWALDGRGDPTALVEGVCRHYELPTLMHIIGRLYGPRRMDRHEIASLAPVVLAAAETGDCVALQVLQEAAGLLSAQVLAAIRKVHEAGDGWNGRIPFGCTGGVLLASPRLREMVAADVATHVPEIEPCGPWLPPVGGVAIHGLREAGVDVDAVVVENLRSTMPPSIAGLNCTPPQAT